MPHEVLSRSWGKNWNAHLYPGWQRLHGYHLPSQIWNNLPLHFRDTENLENFKNRLETHLCLYKEQ